SRSVRVRVSRARRLVDRQRTLRGGVRLVTRRDNRKVRARGRVSRGDVVERELTVLVNLHVIAHEHAINRDVDDLVRLEALARHGSRLALRSEERRVGKEWRWRGWPQR